MPYTARIIKAKIKDTDGLDISFDLLAGNYEKSTVGDNSSNNNNDDDNNDNDGG